MNRTMNERFRIISWGGRALRVNIGLILRTREAGKLAKYCETGGFLIPRPNPSYRWADSESSWQISAEPPSSRDDLDMVQLLSEPVPESTPRPLARSVVSLFPTCLDLGHAGLWASAPAQLQCPLWAKPSVGQWIQSLSLVLLTFGNI